MALHADKQTSLISILSTEHGRMRREERDIDKRDLQKAIKFGTRKRCWGYRWMIEYDGIVFIADDCLRREVTCYPSPLAFAEIDEDARTAHVKAKRVIDQKPELCVSHTVLIVDNSGSMTTHDIPLHRDRQVAAYTTMALEFVAEQLFNGTANNSDVVSLVEFSNNARVVFNREPVTWELYNKLLSRRDNRNFKTRESAKHQEIFGCDSNYLPALDAAERLLATGLHDTCALSVFFLPTERRVMRVSMNLLLPQRSVKCARRFEILRHVMEDNSTSHWLVLVTIRTTFQCSRRWPKQSRRRLAYIVQLKTTRDSLKGGETKFDHCRDVNVFHDLFNWAQSHISLL
jgi:hypothetical protein